MAENPQQVLDFLTDLAKRARPQGEKELAQLRAFAKAEFGVDELQPWDIAYYSEKQKQHLYSISDEQLRPYFPENKAVNGLFEVVKRIYGITAKERKDVDVWHPDVRFFELYDENNELRGSFYLDLYARENKRGGAWMDDCVGQMRKADGSLQKPVAYLTCNFNRPVNGKPALFTHDEVIDLDADGLLEPARLLATKRVVVKRPDYAPPLANVATPNAVVTKGHRFDIYAGTPV